MFGGSLNPLKKRYTSEYQSVYDAFTTKPSAATAKQQNILVKALVDSGVWAKLDIFYMLAGHTNANGESLINWFSPGTFDAAAVNSPSFVTFEGFTGDGATSYLNWNWNPAKDGINYTQNGGSMGCYIRSNIAENNSDLGAETPTTSWIMIQTRQSLNQTNIRINDAGSLNIPVTDSRGMIIITRPSSNSRILYKNKSNIGSDSQISASLVNTDIYGLALNINESPGSYSIKQQSLEFAGASLTQVDVTNLTNAFETYMDSKGKGVIS